MRPNETDISLLVIHAISLPVGDFNPLTIERFFLNQLSSQDHVDFESIADLKVSSHLYISRDAEIWQFVPLHLRAWHAGESSFEGRTGCNDYSVGIELAGTDTDPYTEAQYNQLATLTVLLMQQYPAITDNRIVGHCDIAPGRKTDPGPCFDWDLYRMKVNKLKNS